MKPACSIDGCQKESRARGLCIGHYTRWSKGRPVDGPLRRYTAKNTPLRKRVEDRTIRGPGCWGWDGLHTKDGYATLGTSEARRIHRLIFTWTHGPIPSGMFVDHICRNRGCVNPAHLRLATPKQNSENVATVASSRSGYRGVHPSGSRWRVAVTHNYKQFHGGLFDSPEEANAAAIALRLNLFTHNALDRLTENAATDYPEGDIND